MLLEKLEIRWFIPLFALLYFVVPQSAGATVFYISFDTSSTTRCATTNDGLATTSSFCTIDQFTEVARASGDIAIVERGFATTTLGDVDFTSSGTVPAPLIITGDYDNRWGTFATATQTYTLASGSTTITASAAQFDIIVGEWIYVEGDCAEANTGTYNQCEFAYEVTSVGSTTVGIRLPYKGGKAGSGKNLRIMPAAPIWGITTGATENWNFNTDNYWIIKGIEIRASNAAGNIIIDSSIGHLFFDIILQSNGASVAGITRADDSYAFILRKCFIFDTVTGIAAPVDDVYGTMYLYDSIINANQASASQALQSFQSTAGSPIGAGTAYLFDTVFLRHAVGGALGQQTKIYLRNHKDFNTVKIIVNSGGLGQEIFQEDADGLRGIDKYSKNGPATSTAQILMESTTTPSLLRAGGGAMSMLVYPTSTTSNASEFGMIPLFEYPIQTNTTSRTYDVYFVSTSTGAWTDDPTNTQLWIECEYWNFPINGTSTRHIKRSTGVIDFNGSTAYQALSVTCVPTHAGILYLRGFYGKARESASKLNHFLFDLTPVNTP